LIYVTYPPSSSPLKISLQKKPHPESFLTLSKNEIVEGMVLKSFPLSKALLFIKGKRVMARTAIPLTEGRVLSLKVQETMPVLTLKLLGVKPADLDSVNTALILSAIKENLWKSTSENIDHYGLSREALSRFKELMDDLSLGLFSKSAPDLLRLLIDKSGMSWEAKLREALQNKAVGRDNLTKLLDGDLKGLASKFLGLKGESAVLLKRLVSTLTQIQILNYLGLEQEGKIILPVPIQLPDGLFTVGQLLIQLPQKEGNAHRKRKARKDLSRIVFLLDLSVLGPLRADLTIRGQAIEGRFLLSKKEAEACIQKGIPILVNRLEEKGFSVLSMECHLKDPVIVNESLVQEIIPDEGCMLNLIA
jgi:hypothetical protein